MAQRRNLLKVFTNNIRSDIRKDFKSTNDAVSRLRKSYQTADQVDDWLRQSNNEPVRGAFSKRGLSQAPAAKKPAAIRTS